MCQPVPYSPVPKNSTTAPSTDNKEPLPPAPPLLQGHPYIRITRSEGFSEQNFVPIKRTQVSLTQVEIRLLAQHHLDCVYDFLCFRKSGGSFGIIAMHRDACHRKRFGELVPLLSQEDQEKVCEIIDIMSMWEDTLCDSAEKPMW